MLGLTQVLTSSQAKHVSRQCLDIIRLYVVAASKLIIVKVMTHICVCVCVCGGAAAVVVVELCFEGVLAAHYVCPAIMLSKTQSESVCAHHRVQGRLSLKRML